MVLLNDTPLRPHHSPDGGRRRSLSSRLPPLYIRRFVDPAPGHAAGDEVDGQEGLTRCQPRKYVPAESSTAHPCRVPSSATVPSPGRGYWQVKNSLTAQSVELPSSPVT